MREEFLHGIEAESNLFFLIGDPNGHAEEIQRFIPIGRATNNTSPKQADPKTPIAQVRWKVQSLFRTLLPDDSSNR